MRIKVRSFVIFLIFVFSFFTCKSENDEVQKNRDVLKDYFLCCCIFHGLKDINIGEVDSSKSTYFDILNYSLPAMQKVDSLAINFISTIEVSSYEDKDTKNIIILSIEEYKSKRIDEFIKSMDIYMLKE